MVVVFASSPPAARSLPLALLRRVVATREASGRWASIGRGLECMGQKGVGNQGFEAPSVVRRPVGHVRPAPPA
jgi:hypothetical protein